MSLSKIEFALTKHTRSVLEKYDTSVLKRLALSISLVSCLCAGSVLLFPLFTPVLSHKLHYSQLQINIIGSFTSLGMYLPLPILGYLADCHGPVILSIISAAFFAPGYLVASLAIKNDWNFWILAVSFGFIGCATSSLYFTSLLTCAKMYPKSKGLTISAPVTCYGLSSLIGSQIMKLKFLRDSNNELDLFLTFRFFSALYLFLGGFNWVSSSVVSIERNLLLKNISESSNSSGDEESPLLESSVQDDNNDLVVNHEAKFLAFLKDISAYILLFSLLLSIGPSEMYLTNMGSLINAVSPESSIADQVSIHAVFSTLARLILGGLSDLLLSKYNISRIVLLLGVLSIALVTQLFIATSTLVEHDYYFISAFSGLTYGGLFTLYPTIVLSIWGSEIFGSAWGSFMIAPALGSSGYGMLYAVIYDSSCDLTLGISPLYNCVSVIFWILTFSSLLSILLILFAWKFIWKKRGMNNF